MPTPTKVKIIEFTLPATGEIDMEKVLKNAGSVVPDVSNPAAVVSNLPLDVANPLTSGMGNVVLEQLMQPPTVYYLIAAAVLLAVMIGTIIYLVVSVRNLKKRMGYVETNGAALAANHPQPVAPPLANGVAGQAAQINPVTQQPMKVAANAPGTALTPEDIAKMQKPLNKRSLPHLVTTLVDVWKDGTMRRDELLASRLDNNQQLMQPPQMQQPQMAPQAASVMQQPQPQPQMQQPQMAPQAVPQPVQQVQQAQQIQQRAPQPQMASAPATPFPPQPQAAPTQWRNPV